jgi:energy-coupling factor transporter ATP-binding protein EcfA2
MRGGKHRHRCPRQLRQVLDCRTPNPVLEIADRVCVLNDGKVVYQGPTAEFAKNEERVRALAGASAEK